jgi:hypothetical protein
MVLTLAVASAVAFGIVGIGRGGEAGQADMGFLYAAGRCLGQGLSPYDPESFAVCGKEWPHLLGVPYAYPPQIAPLSILLSHLSYFWARIFISIINLTCAIGLAALCAMPPKFETDLGVPNPAPEAR